MAKVNKQAQQNMLVAKFIRSRMIELMNTSGNFMDTEYFDKVFKDVFGVKHLSQYLLSRNAGQVVKAINMVGVKPMLSIANTREEFMVFADLISVLANLDQLKTKISKAKKKDLPPKEKWVEKEEKLRKLYNKGRKSLQKYYGVSDTGGFRSLQSFIGKKKSYGYYDFDDDLDFYGFGGGFDFDYDDDFDEMTPFEEFMSGGKSSKKLDRQNSMMATLGSDFEDDEDVDDACDYEFDEMSDRLETIERSMSKLIDVVAASVNSKQEPAKRPARNVQASAEVTSTADPKITEALNSLAVIVNKINDRLDNMEEALYEDEYDDYMLDDQTAQEALESQNELLDEMLGESEPDEEDLQSSSGDTDGGYAGPQVTEMQYNTPVELNSWDPNIAPSRTTKLNIVQPTGE